LSANASVRAPTALLALGPILPRPPAAPRRTCACSSFNAVISTGIAASPIRPVHALSKNFRAALGEDGSIHIQDLATGKEQGRPIKIENPFLQSLCFSPDGRTLAMGCYTGEVRLWETTTGQERRTFTGHRGRIDAIAFSPDCRLLVTGVDTT